MVAKRRAGRVLGSVHPDGPFAHLGGNQGLSGGNSLLVRSLVLCGLLPVVQWGLKLLNGKFQK